MVGIGDLYGDFKTLCKQWFYEKSEVDTALGSKQPTLVSGTNIKTVNNTSLLGSGNISVGGGGLSFDDIYPVGSIYMSANDVDPSTLFGGTWERIQDKFLLAKGSTYSTLNGTGGSADATLVSHQHGTNISGEYFVTSENNEANNTRVAYSSSGNRYVDGMTSNSKPFHHRKSTETKGESGIGKNMPPYIIVNVWKRTA